MANNKKKKIYLIFFAAIAVLLIVVLVIRGYNQKNNNPSNMNSTLTINKSNAKILTSQVLFNRGGIAFSVKLPSDWVYERNIADEPDTERIILLAANSQSYASNFVPTNGANGSYSPVQILVRFFSAGELDLSEWYTEHKFELVLGYTPGQYEMAERDLIIDGLTAKSFQIKTTEVNSSNVDDNFYDRFIFLEKDDKIFELHIYGKPALIERLAEILNEIVFSFKFEKPSDYPETTSVDS